MQEIVGLMRCWSANDRMQSTYQQMAEDQFDWCVQQVKAAGCSISPVKRSMRVEPRSAGHFADMVFYFQRAEVEGNEEALLHLKAQFERL